VEYNSPENVVAQVGDYGAGSTFPNLLAAQKNFLRVLKHENQKPAQTEFSQLIPYLGYSSQP